MSTSKYALCTVQFKIYGITFYTIHCILYTIHLKLFTIYCTLYHGLATFTEVTFVNVHHVQMSTFVIEVYPWFCLSHCTTKIIENTGCGIMSVSHTPNQALLRTLVMLNLGLRPSFNITQCSQLVLVWGMGH